MATSELRAKQHALLVDAEQVRSEITDDTPAERVTELEGRFDTIMAEHDALNERIEREERLEAARSEHERREEEARTKRPRGEDRSIPGKGGDKPTVEQAFEQFCRRGFNDMEAEQCGIWRYFWRYWGCSSGRRPMPGTAKGRPEPRRISRPA